MYSKIDYLKRGVRFANNLAFPGRKKLSTLMIYGTDLCDSRCKHCLIWAKRPVKHLPLEKIVEVMSSRCVSNDTVVGLEGGEFLLHPEADQILAWFAKNHPNFDLLSNCLKPDQVIASVLQYRPKRLFLSLDGNQETYQYMRGKDGYQSVLKVIEECHDVVPISAMFTLSPYNSFEDLDHVIEVCHRYNIDVRVGIYNDIEFFDTVEKAHETEISTLKNNEQLTFSQVRDGLKEIALTKKDTLRESSYDTMVLPQHDTTKLGRASNFKQLIPDSVKTTSENFDFVLLYDEWRKKNTKLKCYSILDSAVIHPNGDVPICQNLGTKLGNVHESSLDEIFNSVASQQTQKKHVHNCNQCWINFHRKYDIVMLRTLEKFFPKRVIETIYGKYQWCFDQNMSYREFLEAHS